MWFLDRMATHILSCEGNSQWTFFAGNYAEYEEGKKKRLGEEGAKPKRIRHRPISQQEERVSKKARQLTGFFT
jgi:sulfate-transporting ATPase